MLLCVENLHVHYGGIHALRGVSVSVGQGEIVTIIGANGAGKTSFANEYLPAAQERYIYLNADESARRLAAGGLSGGALDVAAGKDMLASVKIEVYSMQQGGYISAYDGTVATRLGHVLCGGELSEPAWMDEQYFLDLEREATLSLAGNQKTQERVMYMLQAGKPLRN